MPGQDIHVVPSGDRWAVEAEGGRGRETFDTQDEAIAAGTSRAKERQVELFIHGRFRGGALDVPGVVAKRIALSDLSVSALFGSA